MEIDLDEIIIIHIKDWKKLQANSTTKYFRVYNSMMDDPRIINLPGSQFKVWITILSLCSRVQAEFVQTSLRDLAKISRVRAEFSRDCATTLQSLQVLSIQKLGLDRGDRGERKTEGRKKSKNKSKVVVETKELLTSPDGSSPIQAFINTYSKALKTKYGEAAKLDLTGKTIGQIKTVLKDIGLRRSCDLIQVYFQIQDPWFIKRCHDFSTFITNIQKIGIALDTGKSDPSKKDLNWDYIYERESDATN